MKLITRIPLQICSRTLENKAAFDDIGAVLSYQYNSWIMPPQAIAADERTLLEFMDSLEDATCKRFQVSSCHVFADVEVCLSFSGIHSSRNEKRDFYKSL